MKIVETIMAAAVATVGFIGVLVAVSAIAAVPVWLLWNWLCPVLFGLPALGFLQAWGLNVMCGCLFKSWGSKS